MWIYFHLYLDFSIYSCGFVAIFMRIWQHSHLDLSPSLFWFVTIFGIFLIKAKDKPPQLSKVCDSYLAQNCASKLYTNNFEYNWRTHPLLKNMQTKIDLTASVATPSLYPKPWTLPSLAWDKLQDHSRGGTHPLRSGRIFLCWFYRSLAYSIFLLVGARALMVGPYADSSELSYTTTLS